MGLKIKAYFDSVYILKIVGLIKTLKNIFIVLSGFEPLSRAPKARRIDHYPTGLRMQAFTYSLIHVLNFCAISGLFCGIFRLYIKLYKKLYTSFEIFYMII
jgi:hypothetical protein